jgi:hypothetical protein
MIKINKFKFKLNNQNVTRTVISNKATYLHKVSFPGRIKLSYITITYLVYITKNNKLRVL